MPQRRVVSYATALPAQPALEQGDVLVATYSELENIGRSGTLKGNLIAVANRGFGRLFFRDGLVYAAAGAGIETVDSSGRWIANPQRDRQNRPVTARRPAFTSAGPTRDGAAPREP
jgi:hypothetical protein